MTHGTEWVNRESILLSEKSHKRSVLYDLTIMKCPE